MACSGADDGPDVAAGDEVPLEVDDLLDLPADGFDDIRPGLGELRSVDVSEAAEVVGDHRGVIDEHSSSLVLPATLFAHGPAAVGVGQAVWVDEHGSLSLNPG